MINISKSYSLLVSSRSHLAAGCKVLFDLSDSIGIQSVILWKMYYTLTACLCESDKLVKGRRRHAASEVF